MANCTHSVIAVISYFIVVSVGSLAEVRFQPKINLGAKTSGSISGLSSDNSTSNGKGPLSGDAGDPSRIIGGFEAIPHQFPWQVALLMDNNHFCGGTLISQGWVLSAAQCLHAVNSVTVIAGAHNYVAEEPTQVRQLSSKIILHEQWSPYLFSANDIALIELETAMPLSGAINSIALPSRYAAELPGGTVTTITGWGQTSQDSLLSSVLRYADVYIEDPYWCSQTYGPTVINDNVICISTMTGQGFCGGDTGGPLYHLEMGTPVLRGVQSFVSPGGCVSGYPIGLTDVAEYLDWISLHTGLPV